MIRKKGFTQIELLVVIAVIALLVTSFSVFAGQFFTENELREMVKSKVEIVQDKDLLLAPFLTSAGRSITKNELREMSKPQFEIVRDESTITIMTKGRKMLTYQHALKDVPEGVNPIYRRSGYIHPLYSPEGHVLTRIQPPDHYHHYGIWNPWTKTHIEGQEVDFWNLAKGMGTVRFAGVKSIRASNGNAGFTVKQEHVQLKGSDRAPRVAIEEILDIHVTVGKLDGRTAWNIRFTSTLRNVLDVPIELDQYRYGGGLGFRATEKWIPEKTSVLTSEGKTRKNADGSRARWCDVNGEFSENENAGILFFNHPQNHDSPQPMRVWPKGEMFFEFCPIRLTSWTLEPQKEYKQQYQMHVYDGKLKPETVGTLWEFYEQHWLKTKQ